MASRPAPPKRPTTSRPPPATTESEDQDEEEEFIEDDIEIPEELEAEEVPENESEEEKEGHRETKVIKHDHRKCMCLSSVASVLGHLFPKKEEGEKKGTSTGQEPYEELLAASRFHQYDVVELLWYIARRWDDCYHAMKRQNVYYERIRQLHDDEKTVTLKNQNGTTMG